jgi:hypothetical protein
MPSKSRRFDASEHLKGFSAANVPAATCSTALQSFLSTFGPVNITRHSCLAAACEYLFPVKSFTTRFLVLGYGNWSIIVGDMRDQNSHVDNYAVSRETLCCGFSITYRHESREFHVFENGAHIRQVESSLDFDHWHFLERGPLQPFEDVREFQKRRKKDRLSVAAVCSYFKAYTGFEVPNWRLFESPEIYGLERSLKDLEVPVIHFETVMDV